MVCCDVVWCGMLWCAVVCCGVVWCDVVCCGVLWCAVVWCGVHLAICIKVGVEPNSPMAGSLQVDQHGVIGVASREENIKHKTAVGVGSVCRSCDEHLYMQGNAGSLRPRAYVHQCGYCTSAPGSITIVHIANTHTAVCDLHMCSSLHVHMCIYIYSIASIYILNQLATHTHTHIHIYRAHVYGALMHNTHTNTYHNIVTGLLHACM